MNVKLSARILLILLIFDFSMVGRNLQIDPIQSRNLKKHILAYLLVVCLPYFEGLCKHSCRIYSLPKGEDRGGEENGSAPSATFGSKLYIDL